MAAPTRNLFLAVTGSTGTTSFSPTLTTLATGSAVKDLIVVAMSWDGNPTLTLDATSAGNGWVNLGTAVADGTGACKIWVFVYEVFNAGTIDTLTVTSSASEAVSCQAFRIRGDGVNTPVYIAGTYVGGNSTNPDPPSVSTPSTFGTRDIYSLCGWGGDGITASTAAPTNYANHQSATISNAANGTAIGSADRTLNATAQGTAIDPGGFTRATEQWVAYHLLFANAVAPSLTQRAFRFYEDGTESGSTAIAAENTNINRELASPNLHLRMGFQHTSGDSGGQLSLRLQYSRNGGAYTNVTTSATHVRPYTGSALTNGSATTQRLSSGTGSFDAGYQSESTGVTAEFMNVGTFSEDVYAISLQAGALSVGDTLDFRLVDEDGTLTASFTYSQTPRITIVAPTLQTLTWATGGSVSENAPNSTTVGTLANKTSGSSFSLSDSAGGRFAINSSTGVVTVADTTLLNYENNTTHNITIVETLAGATGSPKSTTLAVTINNLNQPGATAWSGLVTTAWKVPQSLSAVASWTFTGVADVQTDDDVYASASAGAGLTTPQYLVATNFGLTSSDIPTGATVSELNFRLCVKSNQSNPTNYPGLITAVMEGGLVSGSDQEEVGGYGGTTETDITIGTGLTPNSYWGCGTLTGLDVTDTNFGVGIKLHSTFNSATTGYVEKIEMRVSYDSAGGSDPSIASTASVGTHLSNLSKPNTDSLAIVGGTGSSMFELYNNSGAWGVRTSAALSAGSYTLQIRDTTNGPVGSEEVRTDTLNLTVTGGGGGGTGARSQGYIF